MSTLNKKWSMEETTCLIGIYADNFSSLEKMNRKKPIYDRMSRRMEECGFQRTSSQIAKKIANLRSDYSKNHPGPTGDEAPKWVHYAALHKILHERPALNSTVAQTSEIGLDEDATSANDTDEEEDTNVGNQTVDPLTETSETPPPKKKQRVTTEATRVCQETLDFMKEQAALRQQEREECREANNQLLSILDRIATSSETLANNAQRFVIVNEN